MNWKTLVVFGFTLLSSAAFAGQFAVGEHVVDLSGGYEGATILEIYSDGTAYINYDGYDASRVVPISQLGERVDSLHGYSTGEHVIDLKRGGDDATIVEIYSDGSAFIHYHEGYDARYVKLSDLGRY